MTFDELTAQADALRAETDGSPSQLTDVALMLAETRVENRGGLGVVNDHGFDFDTIAHHTMVNSAMILNSHPAWDLMDRADSCYLRGLLVGLELARWSA